jgi:hypothetical protein
MPRHKLHQPKAPYVILHAKRRWAERIGGSYPATGKTLSEIRRMIQSGQSHVIRHQSANIKHHLLDFDGQKIVAVYDKSRKLIRTVWKHEEENQNE